MVIGTEIASQVAVIDLSQQIDAHLVQVLLDVLLQVVMVGSAERALEHRAVMVVERSCLRERQLDQAQTDVLENGTQSDHFTDREGHQCGPLVVIAVVDLVLGSCKLIVVQSGDQATEDGAERRQERDQSLRFGCGKEETQLIDTHNYFYRQ